MPRLPRVSARELIRALEQQGSVVLRAKGSHRIYRYPEMGKRVTVLYHAGRTIPPGTVAKQPAGRWHPPRPASATPGGVITNQAKAIRTRHPDSGHCS